MYQLYNIDNNKKSNVKGFWLDENNKLYTDNIHIEYSYKLPEHSIQKLLNDGEDCIFLKISKCKFISDTPEYKVYIIGKEKTKILNTCIIKKYKIYDDIDNIIIDTLKKYNGCTVHYKGIDIIIEIWEV